MNSFSADTIYALATAPGRAGVAILRLSGPAARALPAAFGADLPAPRHAAFTRWMWQDECLDQGLTLFFPGPHSYTGEDVLELHLHGSPAVLRAFFAALSSLPGIRLAEPGEFTRRAYLNGKMDLTAAEGLADLIEAETDAQRLLAQRQMDGAHRVQFEGLRQRMLQAMALFEAVIDFADEDVPPETIAQAQHAVQQLAADLTSLLAHARDGMRLREGTRVVLLGPPNAGKSTLLNALAKREAAIVSPIAGTTRDVVEVHRQIAGRLVILTDTAGLHATNDPIEQEGIRRALARAQHADLILVLEDSARPESSAALEPYLAELPISVPTKRWANKRDLIDASSSKPNAISAQNADDVARVEQWIESELMAHQLAQVDPLITRQRHADALGECLAECQFVMEHPTLALEILAEHLRRGAAALGKITGFFQSDEVLGTIFSSFCIGK